MSLFDRLYNILRANVNAARETLRGDGRGPRSGGDSRSGDEGPWSGGGSRDSSGSNSDAWSDSSRGGGDGGSRTPPGQDARIAQFYANLELSYGADLDAVKKARKRLLRKYHPDRFHGNDHDSQVAQELTQEINRAHDELVKWLKNR